MLQLCIFSLVLHKNIFTLPIKRKNNSNFMTFMCWFPLLCQEIGAILGAESQGTLICTWKYTKVPLGSNLWPSGAGFPNSLTSRPPAVFLLIPVSWRARSFLSSSLHNPKSNPYPGVA